MEWVGDQYQILSGDCRQSKAEGERDHRLSGIQHHHRSIQEAAQDTTRKVLDRNDSEHNRGKETTS